MGKKKEISREVVYVIIAMGLCFSLFTPIYIARINQKPGTITITGRTITIPTDEELEELEKDYKKISVYQNMTEIENEILQKYEEVFASLVCSKANRNFNEMEEKFFTYQGQITQIQKDLESYQKSYNENMELVAQIPKCSRVYQEYNNRMENLKVETSSVYKVLQECKIEELSDLYEEAKKFANDWVEREKDLMSRIGNAEAGNCEAIEIARVLNVIENRIASPDFPDTLQGVIYQAGQYAPVSNGSINKKPSEYVKEVAEEYLRGRIDTGMPDTVFYQSKNIEGPIWLYVPESGHYFCY